MYTCVCICIYSIVHGRHQRTDSSINSITSTMENIALATRTIGGDSSLLYVNMLNSRFIRKRSKQANQTTLRIINSKKDLPNITSINYTLC